MNVSVSLLLSLLLSGAGFAASKDACSLVTGADAEAALGEPVGPPQSQSRPSPQGDGSVCRFRSTQSKGLKGKTLSVTAHYATSDISGSMGAMADNLKAAGFENVKPVSGVGDEAFFASRSAMGRITGELSVRKGKSILIDIMITGLSDDATTLDRGKAIAAKVVPKA
jgi:hypothetical protein